MTSRVQESAQNGLKLLKAPQVEPRPLPDMTNGSRGVIFPTELFAPSLGSVKAIRKSYFDNLQTDVKLTIRRAQGEPTANLRELTVLVEAQKCYG